MKKTNVLRLVGIITLVVIIGFSMTACDDLFPKEKEASFEGTWDNSYGIGNQLVFSENNFTYKPYGENGSSQTKGTFTYTSTHITFTCSHKRNDDGNWEEYNGGLIGASWGATDTYQLNLYENGGEHLFIGDLNLYRQGGHFDKVK
jgi:hypothetical protein